MEEGELHEMFPSLSLVSIRSEMRKHGRNEDALVSALMELQEKQGGVAAGHEEEATAQRNHTPVSIRVEPTVVPSSPSVVKLASTTRNPNVPAYWESFWTQHKRDFAQLTKEEAEKALFFDKHFVRTEEEEGKEEMLNVLRTLTKRKH